MRAQAPAKALRDQRGYLSTLQKVRRRYSCVAESNESFAREKRAFINGKLVRVIGHLKGGVMKGFCIKIFALVFGFKAEFKMKYTNRKTGNEQWGHVQDDGYEYICEGRKWILSQE